MARDKTPPAPIAPGDVVELRGRGPHMTVERIDVTGMVACVWFDKRDRLNRGTFNPAHLRRPLIVDWE